MKKAKIMLGAIAAVAIVSGTFAFKAKYNRTLFFTAVSGAAAPAANAAPNFSLVNAGLGTSTTPAVYYTSVAGAAATATVKYVAQ